MGDIRELRKIVCHICGNEFGSSGFHKHMKSKHEEHFTLKIQKEKINIPINFECVFCQKICKNDNSYIQHVIRCKENIERIECKGHSLGHRGGNQFTTGKDITHSDETKKKLSEINTGKIHSDETKYKISVSRKKYLSEHPDKVPYLINHSSRESYPEKYFREVFENDNIIFEQEKRIGLYSMDFFINGVDFEIDGEQHHLDKKIQQSDKNRNIFMSINNIKTFRIRWSDFQKLDKEEKRNIILELYKFCNIKL